VAWPGPRLVCPDLELDVVTPCLLRLTRYPETRIVSTSRWFGIESQFHQEIIALYKEYEIEQKSLTAA
jgi:hypothetical protein